MSQAEIVGIVVILVQMVKEALNKYIGFKPEKLVSLFIVFLVSAGVVGIGHFLMGAIPFAWPLFLSMVFTVAGEAAIAKMLIKPAFRPKRLHL